jgi:hypothetical protein
MSLGIYLVQVKCFTAGSKISTVMKKSRGLPYIEASKQAGDKQEMVKPDGNGKRRCTYR